MRQALIQGRCLRMLFFRIALLNSLPEYTECLITLHNAFWTLKNADSADKKKEICVFLRLSASRF